MKDTTGFRGPMASPLPKMSIVDALIGLPMTVIL
jgi:hypothetical protein